MIFYTFSSLWLEGISAAGMRFLLCAAAGAHFFPFVGAFLQDRPSGRFLNLGLFLLVLVPFRTFSLIIALSLRPPRRRGPSFCIDRKKAKSDQGCALDPDGQRRRSLCFRPIDAAQSAWAGVLPSAMIDICLGGSMLGRAAGCGVGYGSQPLKWVVAPAPSLKLA